MIVAWNGLGLAYGNLGHRDSAIAVYERILRHPDRLSLVWRTFVEGALQSLSGEYALHLSSMERLARDPTRGPGTLPNLALALSYMGRYREAVEICQRELRAGHPFEEIIRQNLTFFWVALDEPDSAQAVADAIRDPERRNIGLLGVALARGQGAGIERNAQRLLSTHGILASSRECALTALAGREANRGQVEDGWRMLGRAAIETEQGQDLMILNRRYWSQALFILANGPMPTSMPPNPDRTGSMNSEIASGVEALLQGDPGRARGIAARLERRFSTRPGMLERIPALMRAWAAQIENRPSEVIEQASLVLADAGMNNFFPAKLPAARWLIGRAFESLAQPDSAAHHYRAALARTGPWETDQASAALIERPVRMRLVIAELRAGRPEVARKEREYLARTVDRPDAIAARELEEVDLLLGMGAQGDAPAASGRR